VSAIAEASGFVARLAQADLLPKDLRASIDKQILAVAATVK